MGADLDREPRVRADRPRRLLLAGRREFAPPPRSRSRRGRIAGADRTRHCGRRDAHTHRRPHGRRDVARVARRPSAARSRVRPLPDPAPLDRLGTRSRAPTVRWSQNSIRRAHPVVDHGRGTLAVATDRLEAGWRELVAGLSPGTTHLALHCTVPGDFTAMSPVHAGWRYDEYDLLARGYVYDLCRSHAIGVTSTRALQRHWLRHLQANG